MQNPAPPKMPPETRDGGPALPFYGDTAVKRRTASLTNGFAANVAAAPSVQLGTSDKGFDESSTAGASPAETPTSSAARGSLRGSSSSVATGALDAASNGSTEPDSMGLESVGAKHITEDELRSQLQGFNVDGKDVMDTLPPSFVGIKYTHSSASDPIACMLSVAEKREFDFPGNAAGITRLVSKVVHQGYTEALECYGCDEKARKEGGQRLIITLMRRPDPQDQERKTVEVIVHQGTQIITQSVTVPAGLGVIFPLSRFIE
jgi:hypothetical protein